MSINEQYGIRFKSDSIIAKHGLAMIFDLEGFSKFFNQPDVQNYVPRYLNHIIKAVSIAIYGGEDYWSSSDTGCKPQKLKPLQYLPIHEKFLGDGVLYVWVTKNGTSFIPNFITDLINRLWNIRIFFNVINKRNEYFVPVFEVPKKIRFGFARGTIYELTHETSEEKEYLGSCINLASRLQQYCPQLGFIASGRLQIRDLTIIKNNYKKVVASKLKGFPQEFVIVDNDEFNELDKQIKDELFEARE